MAKFPKDKNKVNNEEKNKTNDTPKKGKSNSKRKSKDRKKAEREPAISEKALGELFEAALEDEHTKENIAEEAAPQNRVNGESEQNVPVIEESALSELFDTVLEDTADGKAQTEGAETTAADKPASVVQMIKDAPFLSDKIEIAIWEPIRRGLKKTKEKILHLRAYIFKGKPHKERKARRMYLKLYRSWQRVKHFLVAKDEVFAEKFIRHINRMDSRNEELAGKARRAARRGTGKFNRMRDWADRNKSRLLGILAATLLTLFAAAAVLNQLTAYEYSYNGRVLGLVDDQRDVVKLLDLVSDKLSSEHNAEIAIDPDKDIAFKRVLSAGKDIDGTEQVLKKLTYMQNMTAKGYAIYIDGIRVAILDSEKSAKAALNLVLEKYTTDSDMTVYEDVGFAENIEIKELDTKLGYIKSPDEAAYKILTGAESVKTHTVQAGETFSGIASMYGIKMSDLQAANPLVRPERLSIGQQIVLTQAVPMLTVQTVEVTTAIEDIAYETKYENNASMYQGESRVKIAGVNGRREVTRKIVKNNGVQIASIELEAKTISNPSAAIVYVGTKPMPVKKGTGTFKYPVTGAKLTSKFGPRWGRMHYGVDLACATGTHIRASDGGTVISSGYSGSYGYVVKIDHGGGYVTLYAHCSKLLVRSGEKVYQGQHIANVGSTGRSTGPHVHFEVHYMGTPKNPLNYL